MRPAPRLFTPAPLGRGVFGFDAAQARYLAAVLRLGPGSAVRLFNGRDGEWVYEITELGKRAGEARPVEQRRLQEGRDGPTLLFAPVKRAPTELLVQKATELGADVLQPVVTARTLRDQVRLERFETIAREAAEQCERLTVPDIREPLPLDEALSPLASFVFCDEAGDEADAPWGGEAGRAAPAGALFGRIAERPEAVLIGPEGGFTPEERAMLRADPRSLPVSLGPRILRAETAAIVALTLWQSRFGDLT